jgi:hypothetical protein
VWNKRHEQTEAAAHIKSGQKRPRASGALLDPIVINAADNVRLELEGDENLPKALCYSRAGAHAQRRASAPFVWAQIP